MLGVAVFLYSRFDSFWSQIVNRIKPKSNPQILEPLPQWAYNRDSSQASLRCGIGLSSCLMSAEKMRIGLGKQVESLLLKAQWMHSLKNPQVSGFAVTFPDSGNEKSPELFVVSGRAQSGLFNYRLMKRESGIWCDENSGCLTPALAYPPMQGKMKSDEGGTLMISAFPEVHAALRGKLIKRDSVSPADFCITLYHGRELYTQYQHLNQLAAGLAVGHSIRAGQPLGFAPPLDSNRFTAHFRAERSGMIQDIFAAAEVSREP